MKFAAFFILLIALLAGAAGVYAADAPVGSAELSLLEHIFTGNLGLTLGLAVAAMGIFNIVQNNMTGGLILIVLGVLITILPGIYNGVSAIACPLASALGGHCGSK